VFNRGISKSANHSTTSNAGVKGTRIGTILVPIERVVRQAYQMSLLHGIAPEAGRYLAPENHCMRSRRHRLTAALNANSATF
jgi:hypothetical protein